MPRGVKTTNPFQYGSLALDEAFANREHELADLTADARNGQDVVVFAPRRFGKSSLLWRAAQQLAADGVLVAQVDLMTTPTKERLAGKLAEAIFENIASVLERAREKALGPLRGLSIQPTIRVSPDDGSLSFTFSVSREPGDIEATIERLLELPGELGGARGRRAVLVFDEFQEIVEIDPQLLKSMRSVFQRQPEVAHIYLGSKRHVMERIFDDANEPFWRSAKAIELGAIAPAAFKRFIAERFRDAGKAVPPEVTDALLETTRGHPYATQELCYFLWESLEAGATASREHLTRALAGVLRAEHAHFSLLWNDLPTGQKLVIEALAAEQPARPLTADYRRRYGLSTASSVQKALRALANRELIAKEEGLHSISEPFLAEWITANIAGPLNR